MGPAPSALPKNADAMWIASQWVRGLGGLWCGWLLVHLAGVGQRLTRGDAAWLAPSGLAPWQVLGPIFVGALLASALVFALILMWVANLASAQFPNLRIQASAALVADRVVRSGETIGTPSQPLPSAIGETNLLALWVHPVLGESPTTTCRVAVYRGELRGSVHEQRVEGLRWLAAEVPEGPEPARWVISNLGPGSVGLLGKRGLLWLKPQGRIEHGARLWLAGCAFCALLASFALAAGPWMRPTLAAPLAGLAALLLAFGRPAWAQNLMTSLEAFGEGLGSYPFSWTGAIGAALAATLGLGLAAFGTRAWGLDR